MRPATFALVSAASLALASAASAQVVNLGPVNGNAEAITDFQPNDWFTGGGNGGFVNATPTGGKDGTGGFGIGSGASLPAVGSADLRSQLFSVAQATANTGKVDFSFDYNVFNNFPAAGFPIGDFLVQLRFFGTDANGGGDFRGERNINVGTNHGAVPGTWQSVLVDDFSVPAGSNFADIRVSVNVFTQNNIITAGLDNFAVTTVVPEPASLSLLGLGAIGLLRRRRD